MSRLAVLVQPTCYVDAAGIEPAIFSSLLRTVGVFP
jgi:hypothetical protein